MPTDLEEFRFKVCGSSEDKSRHVTFIISDKIVRRHFCTLANIIVSFFHSKSREKKKKDDERKKLKIRKG